MVRRAKTAPRRRDEIKDFAAAAAGDIASIFRRVWHSTNVLDLVAFSP